MRSCSFVKFQALIVMLEQFKCDELTGAPCWSLLKFDVFDQYMKVKVAEMFWGAPGPQAPPPLLGDFAPNPPCTVVLGPQNTT